jgi:hypothetical protein
MDGYLVFEREKTEATELLTYMRQKDIGADEVLASLKERFDE